MSYATAEELAAALRLRVTTENRPGLEACLSAAAFEIDHDSDRTTPITPESPEFDLANRVNILRGVEWYKSQDAVFGVIGFNETGALTAPRDGFNRFAYMLTPLKQRWGVA